MVRRSKAYKDMMKKYKKLIRKDAKEAYKSPWDYSFGLELFVDHLKFMRDYYELGENVWGMEESGEPSRLQLLNMIINSYNDWVNCEDKYIKVILKKDPSFDSIVADLKEQGYYLKEAKIGVDALFAYKIEDYHQNIEALNKEYVYSKKHFFELLADNIEKIWD